MGTVKTDTLHIGIVSVGNRGVHCFGKLLAQREDVRIAALCDNNPVRREAAAQILQQSVPGYTHPEEMFQNESLDGVIITSPDCLHAEHTLAALNAGIPHVLVEKPLATTAQDCLRVARVAREKGAQVSIGFNMRHLPLIRAVKEAIDSGLIGELMLIENREFYDGGRTYMARWNGKYAWSGGLWVHKGSHDFDVFNWWNARGTPVRVSASAGMNALRADKIPFPVTPDVPVGPNCRACAYQSVCPDYHGPVGGSQLFNSETARVDGYLQDACIFLSGADTHDNGIALVEYDNNVRASHMECFVCNFTDRLYTVVGDRGTLIANLENPTQMELRPRWGENRILAVPVAEGGGHGGADPLLLENFLNSIRTGASGSSTLRDGTRAVAVGQAAEFSTRQHRQVDLRELIDFSDPALDLV